MGISRSLKGRQPKFLAGFIIICYSVLMSVPWLPRGLSSGLDPSYSVMLYKAFAANIQFGKDFVYTYGPYGMLQFDRYVPETYAALIIGRAFIGLTIGVGLCLITTFCWNQNKWSLLFLLPIIVFFPNLGVHRDSFHIYATLLPLLLYFYVDEWYADKSVASQNSKLPYLISLLFVVAGVALISLIKQTFLVLGTAVVVLITFDQIFRKRQPPVVLITYITSLLGFWLLADQKITNIGAYVSNNAQITKGFSETMGIPGYLDEIVVYLIVASVIFVAVSAATWQPRNVYHLLPLLGLLLALFLVFKSSFTRHDFHALQASESIIPLSSLCSAILFPRLSQFHVRVPFLLWKVPLLLLLWILVIVNAQLISSRYSQAIYLTNTQFNVQFLPNRYPQAMYRDRYIGGIEGIARTITHAIKLTAGKTAPQIIYKESAKQIKAANPLPEIKGTTDLYAYDLSVLLAYDLPYKPRPVIQSFSAYTSELAELNARSLQAQDAPDTILFDTRTIDGRLPSSDDGRSWPELWTHYDITDASGSFLVLERKAKPETYQLTPQFEETIEVGEWVDLEALSGSAPVWMNVEIAPTLGGKTITTLLRRPQLYIEVELANGSVNRYRVFGDVMKAGQLLSPLVLEQEDFAYLASTNWQQSLAFSAVTRMRLVADKAAALAYSPTYSLKLSQLDFPRQNLTNIPGWEPIERFMTLRGGRVMPPVENKPAVVSGPEGKKVFLTHATTKLALPLPANAKRLSISYGILNEAWQKAQAEGTTGQDGVEFRILARSANDRESTDSTEAVVTENVLFSQWLDPHVNEDDRGKKRVTLAIENAENTEIVLETLPGPNENNSWDWSYWTELDIQ
ncbi:MAG: hypothetical protein AAF703_18245 [Cyanobacteria bacterium P01_D01_bin.105]